ncbi:MAG: hypothetical protein HZB55_11165 [Deltaproteobacteria bacterium]|nr:hypothetical protein [Deltaproteobacteria bacterium]
MHTGLKSLLQAGAAASALCSWLVLLAGGAAAQSVVLPPDPSHWPPGVPLDTQAPACPVCEPGATGVDVPQTGQTTCYDTSGRLIACAGTGQDGETPAGVPWPVPRFADPGDGTMQDRLTGLTWLKDANCIATAYPNFDQDGTAGDGAVAWQHALDFVAGINAGPTRPAAPGRRDGGSPTSTSSTPC